MTTQEAEALKPCPFCGTIPKIDYREDNDHALRDEIHVGCENPKCAVGCYVSESIGIENTQTVKNKAIEAWNTRTPDLTARVKELEAALDEIKRRWSMINYEPHGIVRETMISNLLIDFPALTKDKPVNPEL